MIMLITNITRTSVACLCSCGKLRAHNHERLDPPPLPHRPLTRLSFNIFSLFGHLHPQPPEVELIYIYRWVGKQIWKRSPKKRLFSFLRGGEY